MNKDEFTNVFVKGLLHALLSILSFLFLLPLKIWYKSVLTLAAQKDKGALNMENIKSLWPLASYIKTFFLDFLFDALILLTYIIGIIVALVGLFSDGFSTFLIILIGAYGMPVGIALFRDILQLLLIPFRKYVNWGSKPAQYMDLEIKNK